jgi:peroxiredoxin
MDRRNRRRPEAREGGATMLAVGDRAPLFVAPGSDGEVDLGALLKTRPVVLYFFPRAMTPG